MVKHEPGDTNIFNVTDAQLYRCQIHHYHSRLSRLYLRVYKGDSAAPTFYLLFTDVAYFECPVTWQSAHFDIHDHNACIQLMLETGLVGRAILQFPGAYASLTDHARLYAVPMPHKPVRIIAGGASMLQRIPDELL